MERFPLRTRLSNILCLHISLPLGFGGVAQEGYKLQQTGQVVQDFIISSAE